MSEQEKIEYTKVHAINWFGYQDVFSVYGNLLIAGVTGSGKSILMDLLQLVLVGDQKSKYNQSATGKASSRTLKSYCLGDTKDEIEGVAQYMRNEGATTYVALEFTWPDGKRKETWGLRIEFDSAASNQPSRRHGFYVEGGLDKADWINDLQLPLDWGEFRELVDERGGRVFDTMEAYRREMSQPSHLNFDRGTLDYLLPAAMSFTFLDNFNKFCRSFVLPPDEVKIREVRDSYHSFMSLRRELTTLYDQQRHLVTIDTTYKSLQQSQMDRRLYADLHWDYKVEDAGEQVDEELREVARLEGDADTESNREKELEASVVEGRERRDFLREALTQSEEGALYLHLRDENRKLVAEISRLKESGKALGEARGLRTQQVKAWCDALTKAGIVLPQKELSALHKATKLVEKSELSGLPDALTMLAEAVYDLHQKSMDAERPIYDEIEKKTRSLRQLVGKIDGLEQGRVSTRSALLDAINGTLPRGNNGDPAARALRELCEVADEKWRPAIEIAFGRKFAVVVAPEHYAMAEKIYRSMKGNAPGESLIHPGQALDMQPTVMLGSLAEKVETDDAVARKIVDHLFGRLICVEDSKELTEHDAAIMPDGFSYRRPFAERRAHYDGIPYIGQRGLARQLEVLGEEQEALRGELDRLKPRVALLEETEVSFRRNRLDSANFGGAVNDLGLLKDREGALAKNIERLNLMDRDGYEAQEQELSQLEKELTAADAELKELRKSPLRIKLAQAQGRLDTAREALDDAQEKLQQHRAQNPLTDDDVKRRQELHARMMEEYPVIDIAVEQANRRERECSARAIEMRANLVEQRRELAREFPVYNDFAPDDEKNDAWNERLERILDSDIPAYESKAQREERNWQELFRSQVLVKLQSALMRVDQTLLLLNKELKRPIGNHLYQITKKRNPDYTTYHSLVDNSGLADEEGLFFDMIDEETRAEVEKIFDALVNDPNDKVALAFLDYRNYYDYDMSVTDVRDPEGRATSVDRQSGKFSGGESQSPYFIAILACYLRAYHRYKKRSKEPSIGLVPIDEAFSKLSGERIRDCIEALKSLGLQGVFSMSSGNIPYAIDLCDQTIVVSKKETQNGGKKRIRNIAVSLARKDAVQRFLKTE